MPRSSVDQQRNQTEPTIQEQPIMSPQASHQERLTKAMRRAQAAQRIAESTDNPNEKAAALATMQRELESAGLGLEDLAQAVADAADPTQATPLEKAFIWDEPLALGDDWRSIARWKAQLSQVIGHANQCIVFQTGGSSPAVPKRLMIIGSPTNAQATRYMFMYCVRAVAALVQANVMGNSPTYRQQYAVGCVDAIAIAIAKQTAALHADLRKQAGVDSRALVVVNNAIVRRSEQKEEAMRAAEPLGLRRSRGKGARQNADARAHGRRDGASIYPSGGGRALGGGSSKQIGG